jgi:hypothetical protein
MFPFEHPEYRYAACQILRFGNGTVAMPVDPPTGATG